MLGRNDGFDDIKSGKSWMNNPVSSDTDIVGISLIIKRNLRFIHKAAKSDKSVLILGDTGTGKDLTAKKVHELSDRRNKTFVAINCTDIPEELFKAELFGYVRGSFTGAVKDKLGLLEVDKDVTILFDEIGDLPLFLQAKILRIIEKRELRRIEKTTKITPEQLRKILENCRWNKTRATNRMGKSRRQFYRLLEKHKMSDCIKRNYHL